MGKSSISLENWLRNKLQEQEESHDYSVATDTIRCWIDEYKSHSPTEPEFDTLQEGDWFQGTEEDYRKSLRIEGLCNQTYFLNGMLENGYCMFDGMSISYDDELKTHLTPEEFLRRAENTFNKK